MFVSALQVKKFISIVYDLDDEAFTTKTLEVTLQIGFILLVSCFAAHLEQFITKTGAKKKSYRIQRFNLINERRHSKSKLLKLNAACNALSKGTTQSTKIIAYLNGISLSYVKTRCRILSPMYFSMSVAALPERELKAGPMSTPICFSCIKRTTKPLLHQKNLFLWSSCSSGLPLPHS